MKVAIINYGMGNLASVRRAFQDLGADAYVADEPGSIANADSLVLPGVGAFGDGMKCLREAGWVDCLREAVIQKNRPLLGICLGMQMLATRSYEGEPTDGLDLVHGDVRRLDFFGCTLRIPHVGWNEVRYRSTDVLFDGIPESSDFYFVHSYGMVPNDPEHLTATVSYGCEVAAVVRSGNVFGCQFHPEKSSRAGRRLLRNFTDYRPC